LLIAINAVPIAAFFMGVHFVILWRLFAGSWGDV